VTRRRQTSFPRALGVLLVALLPACAQTVVLEQGAPDGGGGGATGTNDGSSSPDGRCFSSLGQRLSFKMQTAEVIVALDRSMAMVMEIGGGMTQLSTALPTLISDVSGYGTLIRFGFIDFPDALATCPDSCCVGSLYEPPSMVGATNAGFFEDAAYSCNMNGNGMNPLSCPTGNPRPTAAALQSCVAYYQTDPQVSARYVVLITDGEPSGNCGNARGDCQDAEDQVMALSALNVQTVVIDLGAQSTQGDCLHNFAAQQGGNGEPYYYFSGTDGLYDNLKTVADGIAADACHLTLTTPPDDPDLVSVSYGGIQIVRDPTSGWTFDGNSAAITLHGPACQDLIGGRGHSVGLEVFYGCGTGHSGQNGP
jgi:hypothetical protein